ncbi:TOB [Acanthosepion pharaonis]|uniref:TOB n=1 Tax=Acanthosepion pharaonis TaxID=158019 RepID=A0A812AKV0_ACAPH|nr:TOB [Sepia pharaonis]
MHVEVSVALNFVISYLYNKLPRRRVDMFGHELEKRMKVKFNGHWYPDKPTKGSAYRCIRVNGEKVDSDIEKAAFESGLDIGEIKSYLPADLTLWIDPSEVSYRITEKGSIKILYSDKKDDDTVDNIDREVQAVSKSFNPEAQCFKPIDSLSSSLSSLSLSPSSPTSPAGWSNTTSPSGALFSSSTMTGTVSVPAGNQNHVTVASSNTCSSSAQSSGIVNTVIAVPVPTTGASSALLAPSHSSTGGVTNSNNVVTATTAQGTSATSPTVSSSVVNASNGAAPASGSGSAAPAVVTQSTSFLNKPSHTSPQFTASTFAQTKFGSTKLKSQVKRPTRLSPIEFRNYFRQRAAGSSLQSSPVTPTGGNLIGAGNAVPVSAVGVPSTVGNPAVRVGVGFGHPTTVVNTVPSPSAAGTRPRSLSPRDPRLEFLFDHHHHQQHTHHRYIQTMNGQKAIIGTNSSLLPQQVSPQSQQQLSQSFLQAQQQIPSPQPQAQQQQQAAQQHQQAPLPSPSSTGMTLRDFYQSNPGPASPFNASGPVPTAAAPTNLTFTDFLPNAMSNPNNIQSDNQKSFIEALSNLGTAAYSNQFHHLLVAN